VSRDRRSHTSRANLGDHVPPPRDPNAPTVVVGVRLSRDEVAELDAEVERSGLTRSDIVRWCLARALPESRLVPPYEPW
jgi:hypothetical protein